MAARQTGFALLASSSVQEAQDLALVAHAATLHSRVPFLHFFDGFRTSHEVGKIAGVDAHEMKTMIDEGAITGFRRRALNPNRPVLRGSAQNPDVFFQAREAVNPFYAEVPGIVRAQMDKFAALTGRGYHLFDYVGAPDAERVMVLMGSGAGAATEAVEHLVSRGEKVGLVVVRLYRPFDAGAFRAAVPPTARSVVVLDRTKEPGAPGEPLYLDVVAAFAEAAAESGAAAAGGAPMPRVIGGRYGLASKEFTPPMAMAAFAELEKPSPKNHFTVGIVDDVSHMSLSYDARAWREPESVVRAVFYGLGADGTVGANKNSVKIIGDHTDLKVQGYFVYDSKKSGSRTVSHLRFGPHEIRSTYLIDQATFVACHHFDFFDQIDVLEVAAPGATLLLNTVFGPDEVWDHLPGSVQRQIIEKQLDLWVVDGLKVAQESGLGGRINTVLQTCFFALANVLPRDEAIAAIKEQTRKTYAKRGEAVLRRNYAAIDRALEGLHHVTVPTTPTQPVVERSIVPDVAPDFVKRVTAVMMASKGDLLPVSAMPLDGTFPTATAAWEKRSIANEIPIWDPEICIDCARCALVCPHAAIRVKAFDPGLLAGAPDGFLAKEASGRELEGKHLTIQVAPDDCTGCGVCVDVCPAKSKEEVKHKAINMEPKVAHLERERANFDFFLSLPEIDRSEVKADTVKGSQLLQPLFEFSGACSGCGETPYVKLISQLFGDRMVVANATGCSSIYGGNLPTTPWSADAAGRGPAWANSLFEDNAEFGLGLRLAHDQLEEDARLLVTALAPELGDLAVAILDADQTTEAGVAAQRARVEELKRVLAGVDGPLARRLEPVADALVRTVIWIVGGDGWAYDIGFGGLDHVFATGRDVNILVLDTEVYSNTGGQASKSTPRAAVAKFAAGGKPTGKKDLGQIAMAYGNVYVAQVAMGANMTQTVRAFVEAEQHRGVSLILAYSPCIAHGIEMSTQMSHQREATESGYWPLYRYDPAREHAGEPGLRLDSRKPTIKFADFARKEARFAMLAKANPERADELLARAQQDIDDRWHFYEQMVTIHRTAEYAEVAE
jgi:pyruvate-ferredoxin/flavodoxin oxidoreductase